MSNAVVTDPVSASADPRAKAAATVVPLPDPPLTVIEARPGWHWFNGRELWRYRELLFFLSWRDIQLRYKQTIFGVAWAILQPLATMLVLTLFFGRLGGSSSGTTPYALFVLAG